MQCCNFMKLCHNFIELCHNFIKLFKSFDERLMDSEHFEYETCQNIDERFCKIVFVYMRICWCYCSPICRRVMDSQNVKRLTIHTCRSRCNIAS